MLAHRPIRRIARLLATLSAASVHSTPALATATAVNYVKYDAAAQATWKAAQQAQADDRRAKRRGLCRGHDESRD